MINNLELETADLTEIGISYEAEDPSLCTTASIERYIPELKTTWEIGEQAANEGGEPVSRQYSELRFTSGAANLDLIELGYYSDEYEGDRYYRVTNRFYETEYYSAKEGGYENFTKWEVSENEFIQEIIYKHKKVGELIWNRDYTVIPQGIITTGGVPASSTSTGTGTPVNKLVNNQTLLIQWSALAKPYKRLVRAGSSLGAKVTSDGSFNLYTRSTPTGARTSISGIVTLHKEYLEIEFTTPTVHLPTYVKVEFYGEELWRSFAPIKIDEESEIIVHPSSTSIEQRYKPPGRPDFPDNFWNSRPLDEANYENYANRGGGVGSWT